MAPDAGKLSARRDSAFGSGELPPSGSSSSLFKAFEFCTKPQKNPIGNCNYEIYYSIK